MSAAHRFNPSILREYDIRGVVGDTLDADDAWAIGRCFGTVAQREGVQRIAVGRDGRLSSSELEEALVRGLVQSGCDVVRIGLGPTPMLYFAESSAEEIEGGVQVTGSHNPADHNGFKMVLRGRPFFGRSIAAFEAMAREGGWAAGSGTVSTLEIASDYVARLLKGLAGADMDDLGRLRIGWDAGNGAGGAVLAQLVDRLPGEHHLIHSIVDGTFPNHHPDPTVEANLADLQALVAAKKLDFGVAFDGDADRIGVVDGGGRVVWGDQLMAIFAEDLLRRLPGATVVADVKMSDTFFERVRALGGVAMMAPSGHSLIKASMKQHHAALGGELTGHVFFADDYYGFDDALYAAVRLMAGVVRLGRSVSELHASMPQTFATPELRFPLMGADKFAVVARIRDRLAARGAQLVTMDGVRVSSSDGWWLLRASNTQDLLTARAESTSEEGLARLLAALDAELAACGLSRRA